MGQSTDAILFYGYCWDDESVDLLEHHRLPHHDEGDDPEWEEVLLLARGETDPWDSYRAAGIDRLPYAEQNAAFEAWQNEDDGANRRALDAWYEKKRQVRSESPCDIGSHCSCDCPMPYVALKETERRAARGYPVQIDPADLMRLGVRWDAQLAAFCKELGIDVSGAQGPGWFLVSNWC